MFFVDEPARKTRARQFDVVVAGGGTAGVMAALASARQGAVTALIESKGYVGGIAVEGGTALHSFFNLWKAFPGVGKRQVVKGLPQELMDRLIAEGGTSGHAETIIGYDYDSVCTAIDTEILKTVAHRMLKEAGVGVFLNTMLVGVGMNGDAVTAAMVESRSGREAFLARTFIDCTGYGDLCSHAGADFTEPNDHPVANSMGVAGVDVEGYHSFMSRYGAVSQLGYGTRSGRNGRIVRLDADTKRLPREFTEQAEAIGMSLVTTTVHDDYFMFIKLNHRLPVSPTNRDAVSDAELELRERQIKAVELLRRYVPGCEDAFITRTSPSLCIRRGRCIACDYDTTLDDILQGRHFDDDVMAYGFHDCAPGLKVRDGGTYGIPYRALRVRGVANLLTAGMTITSDWAAHMSTRNTVCCMGQGQAAGTAAALCSLSGLGTRELPYDSLRGALLAGGVHLEGPAAPNQ